MDKGIVQVICGSGSGKTATALGKGIIALTSHKKVIMIQFLKGSIGADTSEWLKQLEPDLKVFRFEKSEESFENLSEDQKAEERMNIFNGMNFAKKVLTTRECDLLILDEVLGILEQNIITLSDIENLLFLKEENVSLIFTGKTLPEELEAYADSVVCLENVEVDKKEKK